MVNVVVGILEYNDSILLIKRTKGFFKDFWGLPGGKVEEGEHIDDAIVREFYEETGLKIQFTRLLGVASEIVNEEHESIHTIIYCCKIKSSHFKIPSEYENLKWFKKENFFKANKIIIPSDIIFLKQFYFYKKGRNYLKVLSHKKNNSYEVKFTGK